LATARKNIDDNLQPAIDLLHSWGMEVVIGNTIGWMKINWPVLMRKEHTIFRSN
jgi:hypothetical protein